MTGWKNEIISEFSSKEDLIEAAVGMLILFFNYLILFLFLSIFIFLYSNYYLIASSSIPFFSARGFRKEL